jgi:chorismate mutase
MTSLPPEAWAAVTALAAALSAICVQLIKTRGELRNTAAELRPNHGGSLRDAIDRIEATLSHHAEQLTVLGRDVGHLRNQGDIAARATITDRDTINVLTARLAAIEANQPQLNA